MLITWKKSHHLDSHYRFLITFFFFPPLFFRFLPFYIFFKFLTLELLRDVYLPPTVRAAATSFPSLCSKLIKPHLAAVLTLTPYQWIVHFCHCTSCPTLCRHHTPNDDEDHLYVSKHARRVNNIPSPSPSPCTYSVQRNGDDLSNTWCLFNDHNMATLSRVKWGVGKGEGKVGF